MTRDRATSFDTNPEGYDRFRPSYPGAVFDAIVSYADLQSDARVLEIGVGTGQATRALVDRGMVVTGLEPGPSLARFAASSLRGHCLIVTSTFEDFETDTRFDLIVSATAFHWVDPEIGYAKARELLRPGGTVALFWNHPQPLDPVHAALQPAYRRHRGAAAADASRGAFRLSDAQIVVDRLQDAGFDDVRSELFQSNRRLSAEDYVGLHNTYSDHLTMPVDARLALEREMVEIINAHGGWVEIRDTVDLHVGRSHRPR